MRNFFYTILFISVLALLVPASPVSAHVLKVDGSVGVVLHIGPGDDPVAGEPASFYFEIKDRQNKFSPALCACTVEITETNGTSLISTDLFKSGGTGGLSAPLFEYTFAKRGVYRVTLQGEPKTPEAFQKFKMSYDVRVERGAQASGSTVADAHTESSNSGDTWLYVGLGVLVLAVLTWSLRGGKKKRSKVVSVVIAALLVTSVGFYNSTVQLLSQAHGEHQHIVGESGHVAEQWACCDQLPSAPPVQYAVTVQDFPHGEVAQYKPLPPAAKSWLVLSVRAPPVLV